MSDFLNRNSGALMRGTVAVLVLLLYGCCLSHKLDITMADIGRHIRNGEYFFQNMDVIRTNYYSYTNPDFNVINHHWGAGALFFLVWKLVGFPGLHLFFIVVSLLTLAIFYRLAQDHAGSGVAGIVALLVTPILAYRMDIRPEAFSYLFSGIFLWVLLTHREHGTRSLKILYLIPLLQVLWVNLHIYFVLGPMIVAFFGLEALLLRRADLKRLFIIFVLTCLATLASPFGVDGAIAPFRIFENYGLQLLENKPVWIVNQVFAPTLTIFFILVSSLLVASFLYLFVRKPRSIHLPYLLLALLTTTTAWLAVRNFALFGFFALPTLSYNINLILKDRLTAMRRHFAGAAVCLLTLSVILLCTRAIDRFRIIPDRAEFGFGLEQGNLAAAEFLQASNLPGPLFNNFDVGGFLIFLLFPHQKVFVDNRPEAYPASFFHQEYIPMQLNADRWKELDERYRFQSIVLAHKDSAPWTKLLKIRLVNDPEWQLAFVNHNVAVFLRKGTGAVQ